MILNHLDLQVTDVQKTVSFFETFFDLTLQTSRTSPAFAILHDEGGFVLVLQRKKDAAQKYPDGSHLGFLVDDIATVERLHARLESGGYEVGPIDRNARGTMIYCRLSDGLLVEVSCRKKP